MSRILGEVVVSYEDSVLSFNAEQCGEVGFGELKGETLEKFKHLYKNKKLEKSTFIDTPFEIVDKILTGVFVENQSFEEWEIPDIEFKESGVFGVPVENNQYKKGIYFIYTIIADEYQVNIEIDDINDLEISGPHMDFADVIPDYEAGEISELSIACDVKIKGEEGVLWEYMEDMGGMRQAVMVFKVDEEGEVEELYSNSLDEGECYIYEDDIIYLK